MATSEHHAGEDSNVQEEPATQAQVTKEDDPLKAQVKSILMDNSTPEQKVGFFTKMVNMREQQAITEAESRLIALEAENLSLRQSLETAETRIGVGEMNDNHLHRALQASENYQREFETTAMRLQETNSRLAQDNAAKAQIILTHEETQQELKALIGDFQASAQEMERNLAASDAVINRYKQMIADLEYNTAAWGEQVQGYASWLFWENWNLRYHLAHAQYGHGVSQSYDAVRWYQMLQESQQIEPQENVFRLTYGTLDSVMLDANGKPAFPILNRHRRWTRSSLETRFQHRQAQQRNILRLKRIKCRMPQINRQNMSWARVSYLPVEKSGKKSRFDTLLRRLDTSKVGKRKRSRPLVNLGLYEKLVALGKKSPLVWPLPRLGPWSSVNPYDARNDRELAKALENFSMGDDDTKSSGVQVEIPPETKIVTVMDPVGQFLPRAKVYSTPLYLPEQPTPMSAQQRRQWAKAARSWTTGPDMGKKKKKKKRVRFNPEVDYAPDAPDDEYPEDPSTKGSSGLSFGNWKNWLILFLIVCLWLSSTVNREQQYHEQQYREQQYHEKQLLRPNLVAVHVNRPPDVLAYPTAAPDESHTVTVIDFEVARYSDVDPSGLG